MVGFADKKFVQIMLTRDVKRAADFSYLAGLNRSIQCNIAKVRA